MKRVVLLRALTLAFIVFTFTSAISLATQVKYEIAGKWQGKFPREQVNNASEADNPVALEVEIKEKDGKLSGTSTFYMIVNENNKPTVKGRVDTPLIEPQFDGTTLRFSVKVKGQQGEPDTTKKMQMKLTSSTEADFENLDVSESQPIKMKKVQ
jgi:hypothetical protein